MNKPQETMEQFKALPTPIHRQSKIDRVTKSSRAEFNYKIGEWQGVKLLLIVDKNNGALTVTNDIENVVSDIGTWEGIDPKDYFIAYKDTEGDWDGWNATTQSFFFFRNHPAAKALKEAEKEIDF